MVDCHRKNRWAQGPRKWSTALIAIDGAGRVLFLHCRSPYTPHDLIEQLPALPALDLRRAIYLEGGPEATLLWVSEGGESVQRVGSYENGFNENDDNRALWALPNVIGVKRQ